MLLAICEKKLAIFASTGNYFRPYRMIPQILTQIYRTGLVPRTQMCTYNFFSVSRNLMLAAIVKVRICSKQNGSERTSLCAPKVIEEVNFPKYLWDFCAREGL